MTTLEQLDGHRDGDTYRPDFDYGRLNRQARAVYRCLQDGKWWSLAAISNATGYPEASVSARIRDFRKARFGGLAVSRIRHERGLFLYRLADPPVQAAV